MKSGFFNNLTAGSYSLILHLALLVLLIVGLESTSKPKLLATEKVEIVKATMLDEVLIEQEMAKLAALDEAEREKERLRQQELEDKLKQTQQEIA
jgi:colicin import membrane protein